MPPLLADLVASHKQRVASGRDMASALVAHLAHLDASYQSHVNRGELTDSDRPRSYVPRTPAPTSQYFPSTVLPGLEDPALFERMDLDTLFFAFYAQPGTYAQYLAACELKKQSWRFHTKYGKWFQRHEQPKIMDDYEEGSFVYFDHETTWTARKKSDFKFEYAYLEDEPMV